MRQIDRPVVCRKLWFDEAFFAVRMAAECQPLQADEFTAHSERAGKGTGFRESPSGSKRMVFRLVSHTDELMRPVNHDYRPDRLGC